MELKGKRALVTGSSRGIGLAIAEALASEKVAVFLTARNEDQLKKVKSDLQAKGAGVDYAVADLADANQIEKLIESAIAFLGGIDVLVNNAGLGIKAPVINLLPSDWEKMLAINLRAPLLLSQLVAKRMIAQGSGHIINIGSGAAQTAIADQAGYVATKHGLLGFSESMALELRAFGVKVSIINPGTTATHFGGGDPESRLASRPGILKPEDVANAVIYLLKQRSEAWTSVMNLRPLNP